MSDSKLLALLIKQTQVASASSPASMPMVDLDVRGSRRLTIRLQPGDAEKVHVCARSRGLRPATYLACLVHSHVAAAPSVPAPELAELRRAVAALTAIGRNFNQLVKAAHEGRGIDANTRRLLPPLIDGIEQVRQAVKGYTRANLSSWSARDV